MQEGPWSVLIIEDNVEITQNLKLILDQENFQVYVASEKNGAVKMYQEHKPLVVLSDINLSDQETGLDILKSLKADSEIVSTFIVMTGMIHDHGYLKAALKLGAVEYLYKPFPQETLLSLIYKAAYLTTMQRKVQANKEERKKIMLAQMALLKS